MNKTNNTGILINHLQQEIQWIAQLNQLLSDEKEILITRQFNELEELANKKQDLSEKLEESTKQRMELMGYSHTNSDVALTLKEFLKQCSASEANQINELNKNLMEHVTLCRELNTVNGQVIATNIHTRQQIVNALSGSASDGVSVYTAHGNIKSSTDNSHHQKA